MDACDPTCLSCKKYRESRNCICPLCGENRQVTVMATLHQRTEYGCSETYGCVACLKKLDKPKISGPYIDPNRF
jgi:hypothetical protein